MSVFLVNGGRRLSGSVGIGGSKNAVLPILAAVLLTDGEIVLHNCPRLTDVENMLTILRHLGCRAEFSGNDITISAAGADRWEMNEALARELRSSIFLLGPIIGRFGRALFTYPGGCEIGLRPIDLHLKGLRALKAQIEEVYGYIICKPSSLVGTTVNLDYPSVGATENLMMAAVRAQGHTTIHNAAREPEIVSLQEFINAMGGKVSGAGGTTVEIEGVSNLHGAEFEIPADRIVAGTYLTATAMAGGDVDLRFRPVASIYPVISKLRDAGCDIYERQDGIRIQCNQRPFTVGHIETMPHPGFPTDMQAQFFALATISLGTTVIMENVFENRYRHAGELARMGANITIRDRMAIIHGVERLSGVSVSAGDLRGGAALVLAGLAANGVTRVDDVRFVDRGYEALDKDLAALGADICRA